MHDMNLEHQINQNALSIYQTCW